MSKEIKENNKNIIKKSIKSNFLIDFFDYIYINIALIFTKLFIKFKITANQVTVISGLFAILGCILILNNTNGFLFLGIVFFNLYIILDCSDGQVARFNQDLNRGGQYLDLLMHMYAGPISKFCMGISIYFYTENKFFILLAFLCSYFDAPNFAKFLSLGTLIGQNKEYINDKYVLQALFYQAEIVGDNKNKSFLKHLVNQLKMLLTQPYFFIIFNAFIMSDIFFQIILNKEVFVFRIVFIFLLSILNLGNILHKTNKNLKQLTKISTGI